MALNYFQFVAHPELLWPNDSLYIRKGAMMVGLGPISSSRIPGELFWQNVTHTVFCTFRFGRGFTVKVHLKNNKVSMETLTKFMQLHFPKTYLKVSGGSAFDLGCLFQ